MIYFVLNNRSKKIVGFSDYRFQKLKFNLLYLCFAIYSQKNRSFVTGYSLDNILNKVIFRRKDGKAAF